MTARAKWFSFMDLKSGYWQIALHSSNKETAFLLDGGCGNSQLWPSKECEVPGTYCWKSVYEPKEVEGCIEVITIQRETRVKKQALIIIPWPSTLHSI
jgi:hypothetical protein